MKQLTESLLTLARSDSGQETAVCALVDLSFIVNSSLMTFEPLVFDMDKHIIYDIEASLHVNGDEKNSGSCQTFSLTTPANTVWIKVPSV